MSKMTSSSPDVKELMKNTLLELKNLRTELANYKNAESEPIAVVGMGCRFPGDANGPEAYWELLSKGRDAVVQVPPERWNRDIFFSEDKDKPGSIYVDRAAYLNDIGHFDAPFFGISAHEARTMDPQQRLMMEVSWEALEHAGFAPDSLFGSNTGVFVGICGFEYGSMMLGEQDPAKINAYCGTGSSLSLAACRLSYFLGLKGPALAVDTACSSSLVSLDLASNSLRRKDCDIALAGGVNLLLSPGLNVNFCKAHMLAPDARCKTFDDAADGYTRGEGCGVVVLKRLSDAQRDGDRILAKIVGSAVNQDGASAGLTVPSGPSQEAVIQKALKKANVNPETISYVEAHGTGTSLGDPIEMAALCGVFGKQRDPENTLYVGSVKTNIGHLEAAAGMASFIKVVLSLQHAQIPQHLHLTKPSSKIDWESAPVKVPTQLEHWKKSEEPRRAGISGFGFGGTNAHIIIEEEPKQYAVATPTGTDKTTTTNSQTETAHALVFSAKSQAALKNLASRYLDYFNTNPKHSLNNICRTAAVGRNHFPYRVVMINNTADALTKQLHAFINNETNHEALISGKTFEDKIQKPVFLFSGQGSQYPDMGRALFESEPVFEQTLRQCNDLLAPYMDRQLLEVMYPAKSETSLITQTLYAQPVLFALEYSLSMLWKSWGIQPSAVMGHSVGEFTAACVAGIVSLEDGLKLIAERARLMQSLPQTGSMVAIACDEKHAAKAIEAYKDTISIAAINGPQNVVLSGDEKSIQKVSKQLLNEDIRTQTLNVSHAFHSPEMDPILEKFDKIAATVSFCKPKLPIISNLTGCFEGNIFAEKNYWSRHIRQTVQFATGIDTLWQQQHKLFLEIGPKPTLLGIARTCIDSEKVQWLPSLRENVADRHQILESLAALYIQGVNINWHEVYKPASPVVLPTYPFQRQHYWIDAIDRTTAVTSSGSRSASTMTQTKLHPLIDHITESPLLQQTLIESQFSRTSLPILDDHRIFNRIVVSGASYISMVLGAAEITYGKKAVLLEDISFPSALVLNNEDSIPVQLVLSPEQDRKAFTLISIDGEQTTEHVIGNLMTSAASLSKESMSRSRPMATSEIVSNTVSNTVSIDAIRERCLHPMHAAQLFEIQENHHIELGPSYRWIQNIYKGNAEALGEMKAPSDLNDLDLYQLHPGLIDSCFGILVSTVPEEIEDTFIPFSIQRFHYVTQPLAASKLYGHASLREVDMNGEGKMIGDITLYDNTGRLIAEIQGLEGRRTNQDIMARSLEKSFNHYLYESSWIKKAQQQSPQKAQFQPQHQDNTTSTDESWLIFTNEQNFDDPIAALLQDLAINTILVRANDDSGYVKGYHVKDDYAQGCYEINPTIQKDFITLLQSLNTEPKHIVYQWHANPNSTIGLNKLNEASRLACAGLLHLIQALDAVHFSQTPHLSIVTCNARSVNTYFPSNPEQALLWGMGEAIIAEHPEYKCRLFDQEPSAPNYSTLLNDIRSDDKELRIAWRDNQRYVAQLKRVVSEKNEQTAKIHANATYLITGGLGGLGMACASLLVELGARRLVLVSRHCPDEKINTQLELLRANGSTVLNVAADISNPNDVQKIFALIDDAQGAPLKGVIHAAGSLHDGMLLQQDWNQLQSVLAPKVSGTWNLHQASCEYPLDFFIGFSSATAVLGSAGQSAYIAANSFIDQFCAYRRSLNLPATSINWGPWADIGMAATDNRRERMNSLGMHPLNPQNALTILQVFLNNHKQSVQTCVLDINWPRFSEHVSEQQRRSFFSAVLDADNSNNDNNDNSVIEALIACPQEQRSAMMADIVRNLVVKILGFQDEQDVEDNTPLRELGFDSLLAVDLRNKLAAALKETLPVSLLFDYPTVTKIANYLHDEVLTFDDVVQQTSDEISTENLLDEIDSLINP